MSDLVGFLLARIAEEERAAEDLGRLSAKATATADADDLDPGVREGIGAVFAAAQSDPARVRTSIEVKRRLVELCSPRATDTVPGSPHRGSEDGRVDLQVLRLLASLYAGHADYREEWRP
ncbi:DUF6221 family protein [Geodermatophilus sp. SYSU D00708]